MITDDEIKIKFKDSSATLKKTGIVLITGSFIIFFTLFMSYFTIQMGKRQNERFYVLEAFQTLKEKLSPPSKDQEKSPTHSEAVRYHKIVTAMNAVQQYPAITKNILQEAFYDNKFVNDLFPKILIPTRQEYESLSSSQPKQSSTSKHSGTASSARSPETTNPKITIMPIPASSGPALPSYEKQEIDNFWKNSKLQSQLQLVSSAFDSHKKEFEWLQAKILQPATNYEHLKKAEQETTQLRTTSFKIPILDISFTSISLNYLAAFPHVLLILISIYLYQFKAVIRAYSDVAQIEIYQTTFGLSYITPVKQSQCNFRYDDLRKIIFTLFGTVFWGFLMICYCQLCLVSNNWYLEHSPQDYVTARGGQYSIHAMDG
jgi:hypothetical protein